MLTTPVFRGLKQQLGAEVHHLCKPQFAKVLELNPNIDKQWTLAADIKETIKALKDEKFDAIIDLQHNLRSKRIVTALGLTTSTVDKLNLKKWLLVNLKWNRLPDVHIVDRYLDTCDHLSIKNDGKGLDYYLPEDKDSQRQSILSKYQIGNTYLCIAIGAAHQTKQIPIDKMVEVCNHLTRIPIILLGGPNDKERGDAVVDGSNHQRIINTAGSLSLIESCIVLENAQSMMTPDTGLMHIAAAFDVPTVSLWGNTVPQFGMYPYPKNPQSTHQIVEVTDLGCRPCSKIGYPECPKGHFKCMNDIRTTEIVEKISEFIE